VKQWESALRTDFVMARILRGRSQIAASLCSESKKNVSIIFNMNIKECDREFLLIENQEGQQRQGNVRTLLALLPRPQRPIRIYLKRRIKQ
jgi:hypothetical protein